ncbi:MAG: hypothetical protein WC770_06530 [Phycisphaerae bacterium]|jgi:hypothetical protein
MKKMLILIGVLFMAGCDTITSQQVDRTNAQYANYGECPLYYEQAIKSLMSTTLKDPYSAQYRFEAPYKGYANRGFRGREYGWIVTVGINAKNSYGAYIGEQKHSYLFRGENMEFEFWDFNQ